MDHHARLLKPTFLNLCRSLKEGHAKHGGLGGGTRQQFRTLKSLGQKECLIPETQGQPGKHRKAKSQKPNRW